jgi:hypothetical protein
MARAIQLDPAQPLADPREELFAQLRVKGTARIVAHGEAGWTADKGNAKRVEQRSRVANRIAWLKLQGAAGAIATAADVRREQERIAFFNPYPYLRRDGSGSLGTTPRIDYDATGPEFWANVKEIDPKTGRVAFHDRRAFLADIGKQEGLGSGADAPTISMELQIIIAHLNQLPGDERDKRLATMMALAAPDNEASDNDIARMVALALRIGGVELPASSPAREPDDDPQAGSGATGPR